MYTFGAIFYSIFSDSVLQNWAIFDKDKIKKTTKETEDTNFELRTKF